MSLILSFAQPTDSGRIAAIHMAAFGPNAMLRAQFPTPEVRKHLQTSIEKKALADIQDPNTTVLVVRRLNRPDFNKSDTSNQVDSRADKTSEESEIIGFAKWAHPTDEDDEYVEPPWIWPEGTAWDVLDQWSRQTEDAQRRVMGHTPCYRLNFIGTDPLHERLGAGSLMVQWGVEQCRKSGYPIYLESTVEAAAFYEKNGFESATTLSLNIPNLEDNNRVCTYKEIAFIYRPCR